jgi:hypothetical protein
MQVVPIGTLEIPQIGQTRKGLSMRRLSSIGLLALTLMASEARPQYIGGGSTPQGDYLRGLGIAASGLGSFNRDTAIANSINTDSNIRIDNYIRRSLSQDRVNSAQIAREQQEKVKANYEAIMNRIRENPQPRDIMTGDALNSVLGELNAPTIQSSVFRSALVALPASQVRRIPFRYDQLGMIFSMQRLSPRGKGKWAVAFQDDRFAPERKAFEQAVDIALEQMIEGKMTPEAIAGYRDAVNGLVGKLERLYKPGIDQRYPAARQQIREMERTSKLLERTQIQVILAELDQYTGTTVNDLRLFMNKHSLRFSSAETPEEQKLYPELYESLVQVREIVSDQGKGRAN